MVKLEVMPDFACSGAFFLSCRSHVKGPAWPMKVGYNHGEGTPAIPMVITLRDVGSFRASSISLFRTSKSGGSFQWTPPENGS